MGKNGYIVVTEANDKARDKGLFVGRWVLKVGAVTVDQESDFNGFLETLPTTIEVARNGAKFVKVETIPAGDGSRRQPYLGLQILHIHQKSKKSYVHGWTCWDILALLGSITPTYERPMTITYVPNATQWLQARTSCRLLKEQMKQMEEDGIAAEKSAAIKLINELCDNANHTVDPEHMVG